MKSKNRLKEIDIKNRACYYFDDIFSIIDINFSNTLSNKKLYENISVYDTSHKISMGPRPLCIRFNEIDRFVVILEGKIKHLILFDYELFIKVCDKIRYLISKKEWY